MWIEPIVECLIDWNLKYLEPETVQKIHGDEAAAKWAEIKQFGKSSFMDWQATGTSSFMQKEVLTNKIRAFAEFALSNPATAQKIDVTELLQQTWDVMEIGRESPILDAEAGKADPMVQQLQEQVQQLDQVIQKMSGELENNQLAEKKLELEELKIKNEQERHAMEMAQQSAEAGTPLGELMARFDAIESMLLDTMKGLRDPQHLDELDAPPVAAVEPPPEPMQPMPEPEPEPMVEPPMGAV
jgi:hypothetical protein